MKKVIFGILACFTLMFANMSCNVESETVNSDIKLKWTTSGDDHLVGDASIQVMKWSTSMDSLNNNFDELLTVVPNMPTPGNPLSLDSVVFNMDIETGIKYYFAMKTADEVQPKTIDSLGTQVLNDYHWEIIGVDTLPKTFTHADGSVSEGRNWSSVSNIVQIFLIDKTTPLRITDLSGSVI